MCGFIAAISRIGAPDDGALRQGLARMARRGPDAEGVWQEGPAMLGHRRLAILDLDARSAQPFHSACGRYVIAFNGEIYNFAALRAQLQAQGVGFRTTSDTEVLVELFKAEGEAILPRLHGMFAFVIWDRVRQRAFVARDPYGIKPLYWSAGPQGVLLGSQVKALMATGLVPREPDVHAQAGFWMLGSVAEPRTWYRAVQAVPAGGCLWVEQGKVQGLRCWHDVGEAWRSAAQAGATMAEDDLRRRVRAALRESAARHLVADVPVGVFLSGGIDSTALAALMAESGARDVQGVTLAYAEFAGRHEDEAPVAAAVARHYGITHHVRQVTRAEFEADLPRILDAMDQPSIDGVNTWYASKAVAERGLKVVVSGVGGDELFQGYSSFRTLPRLQQTWSAIARWPGAMALGRAGAALQARRTHNPRWRHAADWAITIAGAWWLQRSVAAPEELPALMGVEAARQALHDFSAETRVAEQCGPLATDSALALAQMESMAYLRNQLLRDSDWASMDHSVELRTPLVDAHLLEQLAPCLAQFGEFPGKTLLAQAPGNPLPAIVTERRKTGFGIPVQQWLGGASAPPGPRLSGWARWMRRVVDHYDGT
jgi:asparagine synthase (glutamine-hydrolysing)